MPAVFLLCVLLVCAVHGSEKDPRAMYGILGDVMKEQLGVIKHCMLRRCTGSSHRRHRNIIAFHSYPSKNIENIPKNTKVVFDVASENIGRAYDPTTGIFAAPVDGAYVFHWTTMIKPGTYFATILKVNGAGKAYIHGYAQNHKDWYSPSQMFVGNLKRGDKVWLSTDGSGGQFLHAGIRTTFSGFLL